MSLANIIGSKKFVVLGKSLTYIRNNKGPSIDPCGTTCYTFEGFAFAAAVTNILFTATKVALKTS